MLANVSYDILDVKGSKPNPMINGGQANSTADPAVDGTNGEAANGPNGSNGSKAGDAAGGKRSSSWQEDFSRFRDQLRDLDQAFINAINMAYEGVNNVTDYLALTKMYYGLAFRDSIQQVISCTWVESLKLNHV